MEAGTQLGHYTVLSELGRGGMGEVWRARDTKLGREVAIKTLPEEFSSDPDRLARFERETKLLASLNHPNIAAIYGLDEFNGVRFLVLELVEGDTLQECLKRGAIPVEEALTIAKQVAEALEAVHEKDIIHRDLKPANVKITPDGRVKVLDFGLAKPFLEATKQDFSNSPTLSMAATGAGVILGTAAYMSPEQTKGTTVDKRTDIWSFGVVLHEMLTGKPVFQGESVTEILAGVLRGEPDWQALPIETPESIRVLLRRCLQKDARQRFRDAGDVRIQIEEAQAAPAATVLSAVTPVSGRVFRRWMSLTALVCLLAGGIIAGFTVWKVKPAPPQAVSRAVIPLPSGQRLDGLNGPAVALSPDGTQLVYVATDGGTQRLYVRPIDSLEARPLAGTENASAPFFSPDGQWIGFFAASDLKKVQMSGGPALTRLTFDGRNTAPHWTPDGKTVVYSSNRSGTNSIFWKLADGSGPEELLITTSTIPRPQSFTPDGRTMLFGDVTADTHVDIWMLPLDGERKPRVFLQTPLAETLATLSPEGNGWPIFLTNPADRKFTSVPSLVLAANGRFQPKEV